MRSLQKARPPAAVHSDKPPCSQLLADLFARSLATRAAVRLRADALAAFFARALRSAAVMFFAAFLPPWLPYALPILRRYSSTSCGMRLGMV